MMNLIAIYGAGLIIGAALLVIVPEGMTVLNNAINNTQNLENPDNINKT